MTAINSYVYVIEGEAESLLGRKSCFDLEILKPVKSVKQVELNCGKVSDTRLNSLLKEYNDLFHGLGLITNYSHKIKIDPNVKPVSQRLRRIPLSQIEQVNDEINKMLKDDVIQEAPPPAKFAELRSFLGVCGCVSKFIPNYAELVEPLRRLTRQMSGGHGVKSRLSLLRS